MRRTLDQISLADLLQSEGRVTDLLRSRLTEAVLEPPSDLVELTPLRRAPIASACSLSGVQEEQGAMKEGH